MSIYIEYNTCNALCDISASNNYSRAPVLLLHLLWCQIRNSAETVYKTFSMLPFPVVGAWTFIQLGTLCTSDLHN